VRFVRRDFEAIRDQVAAAEPTAPRKFTVLVARFPGNNQEHPDSSGWVMETHLWLASDPRVGRVIPWRLSDTPITMTRNKCIKDALALKADYVLMIDSDMSPDLPGQKPFWDTAWAFLLDRRDREDAGESLPPATIAAPYCGPPPQEGCYVFQWKCNQSDCPDLHSQDFRLEMFEREAAAVRTGIERVAALPTGLILYDLRVFAKLPKPWFAYEWKDEEQSQKASTEDVFQTRNASLVGCPQYVAWDCWAGHMKLKRVGKPTVLTDDAVGDVLRAAIQLGHKSGEKLRLVGTDDRPPLPPARSTAE
jgi:hypothetical protein